MERDPIPAHRWSQSAILFCLTLNTKAKPPIQIQIQNQQKPHPTQLPPTPSQGSDSMLRHPTSL